MEKKNTWIVVVVIVVLIVILGYVGRHHIKSMMMGSSAPTAAPASVAVASPSMMATASAAAMPGQITMTKSGPKGMYLTDEHGMTLYVYDKDKPNVSNCTGECIANWPPYTTAKAPAPSPLPANIGTIKTTAGEMQYTYNKMPLYYYVGDKAAGDTTGDGVGGIWHLVIAK